MEGDDGMSKEELRKRKARERVRERRADPEFRKREYERRKFLAGAKKANASGNVPNTDGANIRDTQQKGILPDNASGLDIFYVVPSIREERLILENVIETNSEEIRERVIVNTQEGLFNLPMNVTKASTSKFDPT